MTQGTQERSKALVVLLSFYGIKLSQLRFIFLLYIYIHVHICMCIGLHIHNILRTPQHKMFYVMLQMFNVLDYVLR